MAIHAMIVLFVNQYIITNNKHCKTYCSTSNYILKMKIFPQIKQYDFCRCPKNQNLFHSRVSDKHMMMWTSTESKS